MEIFFVTPALKVKFSMFKVVENFENSNFFSSVSETSVFLLSWVIYTLRSCQKIFI